MNLGPNHVAILRVLRRSTDPLSGRRVAEIVGLAPNTALRVLRGLHDDGLVSFEQSGRAKLWTTTADLTTLGGYGGETAERTVLVVTAVELEFTEVRNRLVNAKRVRVGDGMWLVQGEVLGPNITWTVYLAQAGMGNAPAAALVGLAADKLNANVVAFVGTAGGLKFGDQTHGDVVVASRIHNPYVGKQVVEGEQSTLLGRDKTYVVPAQLLQMVSASIADSHWTPSPGNEHYDQKYPHAFVAPIAAVDAVQTDPNGALIEEIRSRFQDAAALDMESYGLAAGADLHDLPVLVVRGLSDFLADKSKSGNDNLQPTAAANAASLLLHILSFGHPDDFRRIAGTTPEPSNDGSTGSGQGELILPGGLQIWLDRLTQRSQARGTDAVASLLEMRASGTTAATYLSRVIHRPPAWLREDDTGDGWALVGHLAALAGSKVSWRAFSRAGEAAVLTGDRGAEAYYQLTAAIHQIIDQGAGVDGVSAPERASEVFGAIPPDVAKRVQPVMDFYLAAFAAEADHRLGRVKETAEIALTWLGFEDSSGTLTSRPSDLEPYEFDDDVRDILVSSLLQQLARSFLMPGSADDLGVGAGLSVRNARGNPVVRDLADDALHLARQAVELRPASESARLLEAQSLLGVLVAASGRPESAGQWDISARLREIEVKTLEIRDTFRDWNAESGPPLAAAARARLMQGDPAGALSLLLSAPDGVATQAEASHPEVVRVAAFLAMATGRDELALDLVAKDDDGGVEAGLLRASILASRTSMASEAIDALFETLAQASGQVHNMYRALSGLIRLYVRLSDEQRDIVRERIEQIAAIDAELAELLQARIALEIGDAQLALEIVRGAEKSELALMTRADALLLLGREVDAWQTLHDEGIHRADIELLLAALELAMSKDLRQQARETAKSIQDRDVSGGTTARVLQRLIHVERLDENWTEVLRLSQKVADAAVRAGVPVREADRWIRAEALYFLGRFGESLEVLANEDGVRFDLREKAVLYLSILKRGLDEKRAAATSKSTVALTGRVYSLYMDAAREWVHDEQIAAMVLGISLVSSSGEDLTESQVIEIREYAEKYFEVHGDEGGIIQQVSVGDDNLDELVEFLRRDDERSEKLHELALKAQLGQVPLVVLATAASKSYAEMLVRRDLGCYIANVSDDGGGVEVARLAMNGRVSIDTSSLVVAPLTGVPLNKLIAKFDSVMLAKPLRDDMERARSSLALKSTGTLGWNSRSERPFFTEIPEEVAQSWADAANELWDRLRYVRIGSTVVSDKDVDWLSALVLARESGIPLWSDDASMRVLARGLGLRTFGTLDLMRAYASESEVENAVESMRQNRVVDLPIELPWHELAAAEGWNPDGALAVAIARPYAWRNVEEGFGQFRDLMRRLPSAQDLQEKARWVHVAANGLALVTPLTNRHKVTAALIAWSIFELDPFFSMDRLLGLSAAQTDGAGPVEEPGTPTRILLEVAERVQEHLFSDADPIAPIVDTFSKVLRDSIGAEDTSRVIADLVSLLGETYGRRVFEAYLRSAES